MKLNSSMYSLIERIQIQRFLRNRIAKKLKYHGNIKTKHFIFMIVATAATANSSSLVGRVQWALSASFSTCQPTNQPTVVFIFEFVSRCMRLECVKLKFYSLYMKYAESDCFFLLEYVKFWFHITFQMSNLMAVNPEDISLKSKSLFY